MEPPVQTNLRDALRRVMIAWLFGSVWMYLASGATFTRYAKLLNVSNFGFGVLAAIPFIGALIQLPASFLFERYGRRKETFLWCASLHRFLWIVIAALPFILPDPWQWPALVITMLASTLLANITGPAWTSWMAELVPAQIRGRYFSRRVQLGQGVGLFLSFLSGLALDWPDPDQKLLMRNIISALFLVAGVAGIGDILLFLKVPDAGSHRRRPTLGFRDLVREPLADPNFRRFLGYSFTMTFATGFISQFAWLYVFDVVGMSNMRANVLLVSVPLLVMMASAPFWGRIVDRFGSKPTLITCGLLVINGATGWILITRDTWIPGYLLILPSTAAWSGMDVAAFNLLLRLTQRKGGKKTSDSAVVALNSVAVAVAGTLSGFFGGYIAETLGSGWHGSLFGWPLTYHGVLFLCSGALRMAAVAWIFTLRENKGGLATRDAVRYMVAGIYSNLVQATFLPVRMISRLARATWKIGTGS